MKVLYIVFKKVHSLPYSLYPHCQGQWLETYHKPTSHLADIIIIYLSSLV